MVLKRVLTINGERFLVPEGVSHDVLTDVVKLLASCKELDWNHKIREPQKRSFELCISYEDEPEAESEEE